MFFIGRFFYLGVLFVGKWWQNHSYFIIQKFKFGKLLLDGAKVLLSRDVSRGEVFLSRGTFWGWEVVAK